MESQQDWYAPLRSLTSRGSKTEVKGGLAGLHDARREHLGQFFTPDAIAAFMFGLVKHELDREAKHGKVSLLDTSVGSGRLLQFCDPAIHKVGGCDVDAEAIGEVQRVFEAAGFDCSFAHAGMEAINPMGWSVALLNPPFSVHLSSPLLQVHPCNSYGKFGPNTAAQSDYYAIAQGLRAASVVVVLVPRTVAIKLWVEPGLVDESVLVASDRSRMLARFDLPTGSFRDEGAEVEVSVLVYGCETYALASRRLETVQDLQVVPALNVRLIMSHGRAKLGLQEVEDEGPSIHLPVTGDRRVRVGHDGRKLKLGFRCGFTQARVLNAVLDRRIWSSTEHRLPSGYRYAGQGKLDLQVHLLQDDPQKSVREVLELVAAQDAEIEVDRGLWPYVRKLVRKHRRAAEPLAHVVWREGGSTRTVSAKASKMVILDKSSWTSPVIRAGELVRFERTDGGRFKTEVAGHALELSFEELNASFKEVDGLGEAGWQKVHGGLLALDAETAEGWRKRIQALGIDKWLTWSFQQDDLIELAMCPRGAVAAWDMGLGKSRLAVALVLLLGVKRALVTTEAYLVPELMEKIGEIGLPSGEVKVIKGPEDLLDLRRINVISNERLRMALPGSRRVTYAHRLRRRVGLCISDEGEFLANPRSGQSRALWRVSAQKRFVLSGTPMANYPRDVLPILCYVAGDGTAAQPWGYNGPYLEQNHVKSVAFAERGIAKFIDTFVSLEWCTNEYAETLRDGAKREVPKIGNLAAYRAMLAPHIKRRVTEEPDVQQFVKIPKATEVVHEIDFDEDHLSHYLKVADEFASWMGSDGSKQKNLLVLLLRFNAVLRALNLPQSPAKHVRASYSGLTSKQRFVVGRLGQLAAEGRKTICYAHSPDTVELLARELRRQHGLDAVVLHGGLTAAVRHKLLNDRFKHGSVETMLATVGVTQAGLNVPQGDRVVFYDRDWAARAEKQCLARVLRPETMHEVTAEFVHIRGSADEYQAQAVAFKSDCYSAGLDWATPELDGADFVHIDTMLGRFVEDLANLRGMKPWDLREQLRRAA